MVRVLFRLTRKTQTCLVMNRLFLAGAICFASISFSACTSSNNFTMGGVPGWIEGGAKIEDEPDPLRPDPRLDLDDDSEGGPVEFQLITDKREYPGAPPKKAEKPVMAAMGRPQRAKR